MTGAFNILGQQQQQANAFLKPELTLGKSSHAIYGQADGTGSSPSSVIARYMAISEALERWAFLATHNQTKGPRYGFDFDRSSNGMAAFPGLFNSQAARRARMEALERFAIISWWDGRLPAEKMGSPFPGVDLIRIHHNAGQGEVVILMKHSRVGVAYGHAAGETVRSAAFKAAVELARNDFVIAAHRAKGALVEAANFLERRALFFATDEGYQLFMAHVNAKPSKPAFAWQTVFNGEIPGPWSRWTTVWRHAVAMPTDEYLNPDANFFFLVNPRFIKNMSSSTRIHFLLSVRDVLLNAGSAAAFKFARSAYEAGRIDPRDVAEVFLAVQCGSSRFIESLCARPPGGYRFALGQG